MVPTTPVLSARAQCSLRAAPTQPFLSQRWVTLTPLLRRARRYLWAPGSAASLGPSALDHAGRPRRPSHFLKVNGCVGTRDHAQGGPRHFTQTHAVPELAKPLPGPLLCSGAGGVPTCTMGADQSAGGDCSSGAGDTLKEDGWLLPHPWGCSAPSRLAGFVLGACSEYRKGGAGLLGGVKRCEAYRQPPTAPCWGKRALNHPDAKGRLIGLTSQRGRLHQGLGYQACPSEFSGLNGSSEMRTWRPSNAWDGLSTVTAQILGTGGSAPGAPDQAACSGAPESGAWSGREAPLQGCPGHMLKGLEDSGELDVERRGPLSALGAPRKLPSSCEQATGGPQPRPPARSPRKETVGVPLASSGSSELGAWAPLLTTLWVPPAEGDREGARPGCEGLGEK